MTQLVGRGLAIEFILSGANILSDRAKEIGLVNYVCDDKEQAMGKAIEVLKSIAAKAPRAVDLAVDCINAAMDGSTDGYQKEANAFASCCSTNDFKEGVAAFMEKRKPEFKGT